MPHKYYVPARDFYTPFSQLMADTLRNFAKDKQTIVFCRSVEQAFSLAEGLRSAGIMAEAMPIWARDRPTLVQRYEEKTTRVLCIVGMFSLVLSPKPKGTECIVFASCTTSQLRHSNEMEAFDTQDGIVIDMAGRLAQFGIE